MKNAITKYDNLLIECISLLVIGISAVLTANYFGFPSSDPVVKAQAVIYALGVDGLFYLAVRLTRHYLAGRRIFAGAFWLLVAGGMGFFTYHNNLLFAANAWQLNQVALARAGVSDTLELHLHALIPVIVVLLVALVPRRQTQETRTPEEILAEANQKAALSQAKAILRGVESQGAGAGLRFALTGAANGLFNLEERKARKEQEQAEQKAANDARQAQREEQREMLRLAGEEMVDACRDNEGRVDYELLRARLQEAGKWPPSVAALPDVETLQAVAIQQEEQEDDISDASLSATTPSGRHRTWMTDKEVMEFLGLKDIRTARRWMSAEYKGPYKIDGCMTRKHVRRAPIASVQAVRAKREHEAALVEQPVTQ